MWTERESGFDLGVRVARKRRILRLVLPCDKHKMSAVLWVQYLRTRKFLALIIGGAGVSLGAACPGLVFSAGVRFSPTKGGGDLQLGTGPSGRRGAFIPGAPAPAVSRWCPRAPGTRRSRRSPLSSAGLCFLGARGDGHLRRCSVVWQLWGRKGLTWGSAEQRGRRVCQQPQWVVFWKARTGGGSQRGLQTATLHLLHHFKCNAFFLIVSLRDLKPSDGFFWI